MAKSKPKLSSCPVFILAGGLGTRFSEETYLKPKPMIEIGDAPILLHIMRWYYRHGFNDFVICAGYRSWEIKQYFLNYEAMKNHVELDFRKTQNAKVEITGHEQEHWRVRIIETGLESMTGARVARAFDQISEKESFDHFAVTYGDGLTNANLKDEFQYHQKHGKLGTMLGVPPASRFGEVKVDKDQLVSGFIEKPENRSGLINGGFFFFHKDFRRYLKSDPNCILERVPLETLVKDQALHVYQHKGFWACMDTLRDKLNLQKLWESGQAPWIDSDNEQVEAA